ncbi:MAG TPA: response regulator [Rhizomicrobium sp.]|jgi:YesN/AraC family two-component response regulator
MDLNGRNFLLVDDVRFTRAMLAKMLLQYGKPAIFEAADGEEALALLAGEIQMDCVITDMAMPKLDGLGLIQAIRNGHKSDTKDIKIILVTGHSDLDQVGPALALGLDGFLLKPLSRETLETCLRRVFDSDSAAGEAMASEKSDLGNAAVQESGERAVAITDAPNDAELARDVLFGNGRLLLSAGFRIDSRIRDRLGELVAMAGLSPQIWIKAS